MERKEEREERREGESKTEGGKNRMKGKEEEGGRGKNSYFLGISFDPIYHTDLDICDLIHFI